MVPHRTRIYVAATVDTKGAEAHFVKDRIADAGLAAVVVDLSTRVPGRAADIGADAVAAHHPDGAAAVFCGDRAARSPRWRLRSNTTSKAATTSPR